MTAKIWYALALPVGNGFKGLEDRVFYNDDGQAMLFDTDADANRFAVQRSELNGYEVVPVRMAQVTPSAVIWRQHQAAHSSATRRKLLGEMTARLTVEISKLVDQCVEAARTEHRHTPALVMTLIPLLQEYGDLRAREKTSTAPADIGQQRERQWKKIMTVLETVERGGYPDEAPTDPLG